ncbi:Chaperone protein dnaJ 1, mitochondrial [Zostera marina]|uniref:Chaperone protein dnaJ 1, mitochondrial n=1 Tax=Zostera marina TaxID=29655 RepID=A0A0K9PFJ6_ZOSMR|nr:Chaperone protein dnaJ 1, mitochondrial [Zostera marina]
MGRLEKLGFQSRLTLRHARKLMSSSSTVSDIVGCKDCNDRIFLHRRHITQSRWLPFLNSWHAHSELSRAQRPMLNRFFHATGFFSAMQRSYYEILGVSEDSKAEDIRKAFHRLAKKYHPDANKNNPAAKRKFQEIREAYETLRDPDKRAQYNEMNMSGGTERMSYGGSSSQRYQTTNQDPFSNSFYHIFSEVFENDRERFAPDIQVAISLSFSEAARGCTKHLSFSAHAMCNSCYGTGHKNSAKPKRCSMCRGTGRVTIFPFTSTCSSCNGRGLVIEDNCLECNGSGVLEGIKDVDVAIPPGVDSGDLIHVPKAGNSGARGVQPGDLHIKLHVDKHPIFSREGADIYVDSQISFVQAILGGNVKVPTLSGQHEIEIPRGVQPGQLLILKGKGLPRHVGIIDRGNQYVRFCIHFPTSINERQRAILEEFAEDEFLEEDMSMPSSWWDRINDRLFNRGFLLEITMIFLFLLFLGKSIS